tara:strand:- start:7753 stop:8217 length:465 start_codon:yes stop_codon:yes gene_type:complete
MSEKFSDYDLPQRKYNFKTDLAYGKRGEKLVDEFLETLSTGAFEVKTDRYRNGRMVLEMEQNPRRKVDEQGKALWQPSGLAVTKAVWWVYVYTLDGAFIMVSVNRIKRYLKVHKSDETKYKDFAKASSNPCRGFLLEPDEVMDMLINKDYDDEV